VQLEGALEDVGVLSRMKGKTDSPKVAKEKPAEREVEEEREKRKREKNLVETPVEDL
jgi:hypothetical protein